MSVREAQERISLEEFKWWIAYDRSSPIGAERLDALVATICAAATAPYLPKGRKPKLKDYMIDWSKKSGGMSGKEMETMMCAMAQFHNQRLEMQRRGGNK